MVVREEKCKKCGRSFYTEMFPLNLWETGHEPAEYWISVCPFCLTATIECKASAIWSQHEIIEYKLVEKRVIQKGE